MSDSEVQCVDFPGVRVAALEHPGHPDARDEWVRKFIAWRRENGASPAVSATYNIVHDRGQRYELCAAITASVAPNPYGVVEKQIAPGRCARLRHVGPEAALESAVLRLHAWLAQSGEQRGDGPLFFQRIQFGPSVPERDWVTDIYLPLRA